MTKSFLTVLCASSALFMAAQAGPAGTTATTGATGAPAATTTPGAPTTVKVENQAVTRADVEEIIGQYLAKNPEVVMQSIQAAMQKEQQAAVEKMKQAVAANKDKIYNDPHAGIAGNTTAAVTLVAFMDPYCGYCRKFHDELNKYLSQNDNLKVIFKDIPIMGEPSKVAVTAMVAAQKQGKYKEMQTEIFASKEPLNEKQLIKIAGKIGLNGDQFKKDMKSPELTAQIQDTSSLANTLGITATPTLILGDEVMPGYIPADVLKEKVGKLSQQG